MNSITDLTNKLNYEQESRENKSVEAHKKELDALNAQIEEYEKKIIPLENMNTLNNDSVNLVQNKIDNKIKSLKEEKDNLLKEKSNNVIKISQNESYPMYFYIQLYLYHLILKYLNPFFLWLF